MVIIETSRYKLAQQNLGLWPWSSNPKPNATAPELLEPQEQVRPISDIMSDLGQAKLMHNHYRVGPGRADPDAYAKLDYWARREIQLNQERVKAQSAELQSQFPGQNGQYHAKPMDVYTPTKNLRR